MEFIDEINCSDDLVKADSSARLSSFLSLDTTQVYPHVNAHSRLTIGILITLRETKIQWTWGGWRCYH
jgi:hypothetical protein